MRCSFYRTNVIITSLHAAGSIRRCWHRCSKCNRRTEGSRAKTTRQVWAHLNVYIVVGGQNKVVMLTDVKHGVLWLGLVVYTVETRHVLKESVKIRMGTEWLGALRQGALTIWSIYLGSTVTSKRGWNRHLRMSWKLATLLWVL